MPQVLSQENCDGNTPLHIAASHGYTDVAEELIWLAEVLYDALETQSGEVATETLHDAVDTQHGEVATEMLHDAVDTHSVEGTTVTLHDVDAQSGEVAIRILDNEADIQSGEVATETLHDALDTQIGEVVTETLHDAVDTQSEEVAAGMLHDAVDTQSEEVATERAMKAVRKLLRKVNGKKETALHVAARNEKSLGVVKTILSKEDPHYIYSANNRGETPLYLAVDNSCTNIVAELLNNPNSRSLDYGGPDGETVLHTAVRRWDTDVVCVLLEKQGSLVKKKGKFEWTPLHVAAHEGSSSWLSFGGWRLIDEVPRKRRVRPKDDLVFNEKTILDLYFRAFMFLLQSCSLVFRRDGEEGPTPNAVTFVAVLTACNHKILLSEAWCFFGRMKPNLEVEIEAFLDGLKGCQHT
ncbi:hypothetical protein GH714_002747 [Hevea brasiliensis]|uniref:PGG domain-containing protein n=1 Tax=Hevea brasiliensis TaxID=3981 RepID=A0A6A6M705_HEVBR|nr:hypothetical protein GH714_002747 [Hevea brasiliensis]